MRAGIAKVDGEPITIKGTVRVVTAMKTLS